VEFNREWTSENVCLAPNAEYPSQWAPGRHSQRVCSLLYIHYGKSLLSGLLRWSIHVAAPTWYTLSEKSARYYIFTIGNHWRAAFSECLPGAKLSTHCSDSLENHCGADFWEYLPCAKRSTCRRGRGTKCGGRSGAKCGGCRSAKSRTSGFRAKSSEAARGWRGGSPEGSGYILCRCLHIYVMYIWGVQRL